MTAIKRSPSPSKAIPISAPSAITRATNPAVDVAPHLSLMLRPFGSAFITTTSASVDANNAGAAELIAPLAQSRTIRMPANAPPTVFKRCCTYSSTMCEASCTVPSATGAGSATSACHCRSISICSLSESFDPPAANTLMPLSVHGLCDAVIAIATH